MQSGRGNEPGENGDMIKIYISSTFSDLQDERRAAARAIDRLGHHAVAMEGYAACDQRPIDRCLADVRSCQAYVILCAFRYGFIPPGQEKSITHLEFDEATKSGIPRFVFLLRDDAPWPVSRLDADLKKVKQFRDLLSDGILVDQFADSGELEAKVASALGRALGRWGGMAAAGAAECPRPTAPPVRSGTSRRRGSRDVLSVHRRDWASRPFVVIVHGDEHQCHEEFLDRLQERTQPRHLKLPPAQESVANFLVQCPIGCRDSEQFREWFLGNLGRDLLNNDAASAAEHGPPL